MCNPHTSPLGSPDRPWAAAGEASLLDDPKLVEMGKKYGKSAAQILLRWQVSHGLLIVLIRFRLEIDKEDEISAQFLS